MGNTVGRPGHEAPLNVPTCMKPFARIQKNDAFDAEAIREATIDALRT